MFVGQPAEARLERLLIALRSAPKTLTDHSNIPITAGAIRWHSFQLESLSSVNALPQPTFIAWQDS